MPVTNRYCTKYLPISAAMTPRPHSLHPRTWTLRRRIVVLALIPAALLTAAGGLWLRGQIHGSIYQGFAQHLQKESEELTTRLYVSGAHVLEEVGGTGPFNVIYSGWYWQVPGEDKGVSGHSRSLWDAAPLTATPAPAAHRLALLQASDPRGMPLLGMRADVPLPGASAPVPLEVFGPAGDVLTNVRRIDRVLLASAIGLIAALTLLLVVQMRAAMAPLRRLTRAVAAQREAGSTSTDDGAATAAKHAELEALPLGSDLAPLCSEINALLTHNASIVERARSHAADLNHALKKPLAMLSAAASSQQQLPAGEVLNQVGEMTRLIDRYQARTLSDSVRARPSTRAVPVAECLEHLLRAMRKLHAAQELSWQLALPDDALGWRWRGERTDLEEALGNLLDNAGKWAASRVLVSAHFTPPAPVRRGSRQPGGQLAISIEDDGPGMSAEQLAAAGQRGLRFDEHVHGSGLGLAIAGQIAAAWGAELRLEKSALLKGLHATLTLPNVWQSAA